MIKTLADLLSLRLLKKRAETIGREHDAWGDEGCTTIVSAGHLSRSK